MRKVDEVKKRIREQDNLKREREALLERQKKDAERLKAIEASMSSNRPFFEEGNLKNLAKEILDLCGMSERYDSCLFSEDFSEVNKKVVETVTNWKTLATEKESIDNKLIQCITVLDSVKTLLNCDKRLGFFSSNSQETVVKNLQESVLKNKELTIEKKNKISELTAALENAKTKNLDADITRITGEISEIELDVKSINEKINSYERDLIKINDLGIEGFRNELLNKKTAIVKSLIAGIKNLDAVLEGKN